MSGSTPEAPHVRVEPSWLGVARRDWALLAAAAALATLVAHGLSLRAGFVWDDRHTILANPALSGLSGLARALSMDDWEAYGLKPRGLYRPLATLSFALDAAVWGRRAGGFHLTSLLLHAWTALAAGAIARQWGARRSIALAATAVFAVHPLGAEAADWISARPDVLSSALATSALLAGPRAPLAAAILAGLACGAKEPGLLALPALLLLLAGSVPRPRAMRSAMFGAAIVLAYLAARWAAGVRSATVTAALHPSAWLPWIGRWGEALAAFAAAVVSPLPLDATRGFPALGVATWAAAACGFGAFAASFHPRTPRIVRAAAVLIAGPLAMAALYNAGLSERYLHMPVAMVVICTALAAERAARSPRLPRVGRRAAAVGCALIVVVWTAASLQRARTWRDPIALFASAVAADPQNARARQMLGAELYRAGDRAAARSAFEAAVELGGGAPSYSNLCAVDRELGALDRALRACDEAVHLDGRDPRARYHRALVLVELGRLGDAKSELLQLLDTTPGYVPARALLESLERGR